MYTVWNNLDLYGTLNFPTGGGFKTSTCKDLHTFHLCKVKSLGAIKSVIFFKNSPRPNKGSLWNKEGPKKYKKSIIFLTPPSPWQFGLFWICEKIEIWWPHPPRTYYGTILNFRHTHTPQKKNISLQHLKLPKNHFKTSLIFVELKHFKYTLG